MSTLERFVQMLLDSPSSELRQAQHGAGCILMSDLYTLITRDDPTDDEVFLAASLVHQHIMWKLSHDDINFMDGTIYQLAHWVFNHTDKPEITDWLQKEYNFKSPEIVIDTNEETGKVVKLFK